jgi:hypothetical protein
MTESAVHASPDTGRKGVRVIGVISIVAGVIFAVAGVAAYVVVHVANRSTVMTASFLQASLFTSVVAFGVSAMAAVMGVLWVLVGWALLKMGRRPDLA